MVLDLRDGSLNAICPYFTMFPLEFPHGILRRHAQANQWVLDPFCGRGTTNFASRLLGLPTIGVDSSPVAVALSKAKLASTTPARILRAAKRILNEIERPKDVPEGEFWEMAFDKKVLRLLCRFREGLLKDSASDARLALRAILLGALHGPRAKTTSSYFSNQCPRTYAPKPRYAVKYWKKYRLYPRHVDVLGIIKTRAERYYRSQPQPAEGKILSGDSRDKELFGSINEHQFASWIITSPPYYGMRTYLPDQWLRLWFLGWEPWVEYSNEKQVEHGSPQKYASELRKVWSNVSSVSLPNARMVIRFGGINDRQIDVLSFIRESLRDTEWRITTVKSAGSASAGRRQSLHFGEDTRQPIAEYDIWAVNN